MQKIVVILGPTAVGKSNLAVELAQKHNGEVISADSRQVYKGLDIGTGKITQEEMKDIPHHMLDVSNPNTPYSVAEYQKDAKERVTTLHENNKLPIICGGSGFYIDALIYGTHFPEVPPNNELRENLSSKTPEELFLLLKEKDPRRAENIDPHNPHRLIRAIEIATALGSVPEITDQKPEYDTLFIGLNLPAHILKERIATRLEKRLQSGMLTEAKDLLASDLTITRMHELGLEYHYMALHLEGELPYDAMKEKLTTAIWHYAKRQLTWFKINKNIHWYAPEETEKIDELVATFLLPE